MAAAKKDLTAPQKAKQLVDNVRPALRRQGLGFQKFNIRTMPNSSTGVEFITTALLSQNWLLVAVVCPALH
jgi:hypothetical protein